MKQNEFTKLYNNLKPNSELAKSYDFLFNTPKPKNKQKTFLIRKIKENESNTEKFMKEYDNYFYNPETYFSSNSPVRLGKKPEITDISLDLKNKNKNNKRNNLNISTASRKKSIASKFSKDRDKFGNYLIDHNKFELIDNKRLYSIFNLFKEKIDYNRKNNKSYYKSNNNLPLNISLPLNNQQKYILNQKNNNKKNKIMINYISKKIHKDKEDLIMNKVDNFLYKKEIINKIDNNNKIYEPNMRYKWTTSLRNPDKLKGVRKTLVNINNDKNPFWGFLVEKSANMRQTSVKPGVNLNRNLMNFIKKAKSLKDIDDNNINNMKYLDEISVKGENLFDIEYNREMSSKKRKILHKAFVENGKVVLNTDINNLFGKETFYKNYEKNKNYFSPSNSTTNKNILNTYFG